MNLRLLLRVPAVFRIYKAMTTVFAATKWPALRALFNRGLYFSLREADHNQIRAALRQDYLIILTHRRCHLTTYLIALISYLATGRGAHWTHALCNVEGDVENHMDYRLIEATGEGVHWSTFMQVFDCDSVALLKPRGVASDEWTLVMDAVIRELGQGYDLLFDIRDASQVSCVEMLYQGIKMLPGFEQRFTNLLTLIRLNKGELTPQMLYDCKDMDIVFEVRR